MAKSQTRRRVYAWDEMLARGEAWEKRLDTFFRKWYRIRAATYEQQLSGIDRVFTTPADEVKLVEYKTDELGHKSGNAFIETKAKDGDIHYKPGWAKHCAADCLVYYLPGSGQIMILQPKRLRAYVSSWVGDYRVVRVKNKHYEGEGILVPLDVVARMAYATMQGPRRTR